ncbi:MAG: hypothetical protein ACO3CN_03310 [Candidatus Nanopelagicales bacterium]
MRIRATVIFLTVAVISIMLPTSASAWWRIDVSSTVTLERMDDEGLLQISADDYFVISADEINDLKQPIDTSDKYAVVVDGVIDKIVNWDGEKEFDGVLVKLPTGYGVPYLDADGVLRLKAINQGDIVSVEIAPGEKVTPENGLVETTRVTPSELPTGTIILDPRAPKVINQRVEADYSVTATVQVNVPSEGLKPNSLISVQAITDGRSVTSIGVSPGQSTVDISALPQNANVTIKTVIRDVDSGEETIIDNPVIETPKADMPVLESARDAEVDKATISAPSVSAVTIDATGHKVVTFETPVIPDFDPTKTNVSLQVVQRGSGSTTSVGLGGEGGQITIGSIGPDLDYEVKIVVRDLTTGEETIIRGSDITKP